MKAAIFLSATLIAASPALAQLSVPSAVTAPAGTAVESAGRGVTAGSGAHGGVPAPIVSGANSDARPFADGVTDGTAKTGKGMQHTGRNIGNGTTVSPEGALKGTEKAPSGVKRQAEAAKGIPPQ